MKVANSMVIDFNAEMRKERLKNLEQIKVKMAERSVVFNLLQDLRHLILIDLRPKELFDQNHIRKSINCDMNNYKEKIAHLIVSLAQNTVKGELPKEYVSTEGLKYKSEFPGDDLRRVLFILDDQKSGLPQIEKEAPIITEQIE